MLYKQCVLQMFYIDWSILEKRLWKTDETEENRFFYGILYSWYLACQNCWTLDASVGRWTLKAGLWTLDTGCWTLDARLWTLDVKRWTLGSEHWTLLLTVSEQNKNLVSDSTWLNYWKFFRFESLKTSWSRFLCRNYKFWGFYFHKFYINVKYYATKQCQNKFSLWEIELHYKQLSWTLQKQPSTAIDFWKFLQKFLIEESFLCSNYRLTAPNNDDILK